MPYNSYIDVFNFSTPQSLANYLKIVGSDVNKYDSYFDWHKNYCSRLLNRYFLCGLCRKLNTPSMSKFYTKSQSNEWWYKEANCQKNITFDYN
jgi:hypothetical protein